MRRCLSREFLCTHRIPITYLLFVNPLSIANAGSPLLLTLYQFDYLLDLPTILLCFVVTSLLVAMLTAGLKRTRSPSASNGGDQAGEISPAPVQGSSKDIDGSNGQSQDENGWTSVSGSNKKKAKKQKVKKLEVSLGFGHLQFYSSFGRTASRPNTYSC